MVIIIIITITVTIITIIMTWRVVPGHSTEARAGWTSARAHSTAHSNAVGNLTQHLQQIQKTSKQIQSIELQQLQHLPGLTPLHIQMLSEI